MIHYQTEGDGPAVLFIHAGVADSRMWQAQMSLPGLQTIAFDQRGFGQTAWTPEPYANCEDALAVLDHLDIGRPVVVGCSNGAEAAMQLALIAPSRVRALVLIGAAPRGWEPEGGWRAEPFEDEIASAFDRGAFAEVVRQEAQLWLAGPTRSLDDVDAGIVALFEEMHLIPQATEREREDHVQTLNPPTNERLDRIDAPSLEIVGEHDLPDLRLAAEYLAARLSEQAAVVLRNTAHLPSMDQPGALNRAINGFIASL
jgi:3-oxoadipate enol-lactonase